MALGQNWLSEAGAVSIHPIFQISWRVCVRQRSMCANDFSLVLLKHNLLSKMCPSFEWKVIAENLSKDGVLAGAVWKRKGSSPLRHLFMIHLVFGIWKSAAVCLREDF